MKPLSLFVFLLLAGQFCKAQELTEINVRITPQAFSINSIVFTLNGLDLYVTSAGDILPLNAHDRSKDGQEAYACDKYYDYFEDDEKAGKIRSINGVAIDYYDRYSNKEKVGKIKSIGNINIDYYDNYDNDQKTGKIKSIGNIYIDYYDSYELDEKKGKMKSFGKYIIDYYDTYDWEEKKGKLSTIGPVKIDYYDRFSDNSKKGRIKSVCGNTPTFYVTVFDPWGLPQ